MVFQEPVQGKQSLNCPIACEIACHKGLMISAKGISNTSLRKAPVSEDKFSTLGSVMIQTRCTFVEKSCTAAEDHKCLW